MSFVRDEIRASAILLAGAGMLALVLLGLLIALGMYLFAGGRTSRPGEPLPTFVGAGILPPAPRLQTDPHKDLQRLRAAEDSLLGHYAWVNRDSGLVRIPVERALAIVAVRGLLLHAQDTPVSHHRSGR